MTKELKAGVAKRRISKFEPDWGDLDLSEFTIITEEAAALIAQVVGSVDLSGIVKISDEVAEILSGHKLRLNLKGLTSLSLRSARAFARHDGNIALSISVLDDEVAEVLSEGIATFYLPELSQLGSSQKQMAFARKLVADGMHRQLYSLKQSDRDMLLEIENDLEENKSQPADLPSVNINLFKDINDHAPEEIMRRCIAVIEQVSQVLEIRIITNPDVLESDKAGAELVKGKIDDAMYWMAL